MMKNIKHVPTRTCVACRKARPKRELIRLVRITDGSISVDDTGKMAGRGAYLCPALECWATGLKGGRIEHTLRTSLNQANREQLLQYVENLQRID